ncbi:carbonic anhydrase [Sphingomonas rosea]|uniref:Carbonic anhydrase n=1 Tax=Sphingomonas rosea TaxID=335605 RepID=A0ABP7UDT3_9SPHN
MQAYRALLDGYRRFRSTGYPDQRRRWEALATGQEPPVMIIGCCDSRVDPATIFDTLPGEMFVLRNVANLVPPYEVGGGLHGVSAALEFAVTALNVKHVIVMGHGACGGIAASLAGDLDPEQSFIPGWIAMLDDAREKVVAEAPENPQRALELEGVKTSLANLRTFPFVAEREKAGSLMLHGLHFGVADGKLWALDEQTGEFDPVTEDA